MKHNHRFSVITTLTLFLWAAFSFAQPSIPQAVLDEIAANGTARIIVGLDVPWQPEGFLRLDAVAAQRSAITTTQDDFVETLNQDLVDDGVIDDAFSGGEPTIPAETQFKTIPYLVMWVDGSLLSYIEQNVHATHIELDVADELSLADSIPLIGADKAWNQGYSGAGQAIAILDSGVDATHPALADKIIEQACFSTTDINDDPWVTTICPDGQKTEFTEEAAKPCDFDDECRHGTHVAGIAAGVAKEAKLIAVQVFSKFSSMKDCGMNFPCARSYPSDQAKALEWLHLNRDTFDPPLAAVNMSLGSGEYTTACNDHEKVSSRAKVIQNLHSMGIATIASSGNHGYTDGISAPACVSEVISVGATDKANKLWAHSNRANILDLLAPGVDIVSAIPGGDTQANSGTSMAAPHVAGAWAILKAAHPDASIAEILAMLKNTGQDVDGTPLIQLDAALSTSDECIINLDNNTHNCQNIPAISFTSVPSNNQAVAKITLDPSLYTKAIFSVTYGSEPTDWTVNIGDSRSNNGWAGDGGHQSNDAEMQIKGSSLTVYGNDYIPSSETTDGHRHILNVKDAVKQGDTITLEIANQYLSWNSPSASDEFNSPYIFALDGQSDSSGPVNYDIFAAFNRVISSSGRSGSGASSVCIKLTGDSNDTGCKDNTIENYQHLTIKSVQYGEQGHYCDATATFKKECDDKSFCSVYVGNQLCGDPIVGSFKKAEITYSCGNEIFSSTVSEYHTASLDCSNNVILNIATDGSNETGDGSEAKPFATIQHGIDTAKDGYTVLVHPGTYVENINFNGKNIIVKSTDGAKKTVIDGNKKDTVLLFKNSEKTTVDGFTLTHGYGIGTFGGAGGIGAFGNSAPILKNLIVTDNVSHDGGGISCNTANPTLINVEITKNISHVGGGIYIDNCRYALQNVTVADNHSEYSMGGGIFSHSSGNLNATNSIFWNNTPNNINTWGTPAINFSYSDVQSGWTGEGNFDIDPLFENGYHLSENSPAIGAGTSTDAPKTDLDGNPRSNPPSMGAYEGMAISTINGLTITKTGNARGTLRAKPKGEDWNIVCKSDCTEASEIYPLDSQVILTASPEKGFIFNGWSGDCTGTEKRLTFTMDGAKTCIAQFEPDASNSALLTVNTDGTGEGSVISTDSYINCGLDCSEFYRLDKRIVLEATPNADNLFIGWTGDCSGIKSRIFVTMDAAKNCTATFNTKPSGALTLSVDKIGDGQAIVKGRLKGEDKTIYCTSGCQQASYDYQAGDQVILTANPKDGFIFTEWGGDCSGTEPSITVLMDQAKHCTAQIDRDPEVPMYKLEVVIKSLVDGYPLSGLGMALIDKPGQIDCSQSGETCTAAYYKADETVRLTALSTRFIDFIEWGGDCGDSGANKRASIMLTADMRCEATFKDQFELYAEDLLEDFYTHATLANGDSVDSLFPRGDSNDARIKEAFWLSALTMIYVDQYLNLNNLTAWPDQFDALEWLPNSDRIEYTDSLQIIANGTFIGIKVRLIDTAGQEEIVGIVLYYDEEPPVLDEGSWFRAISSAAFFSRYAFR